MTKYGKEIVLATAPYRTIRLSITEAASFEECDKELMAEIKTMDKDIKELNKDEIKKVIRGK